MPDPRLTRCWYWTVRACSMERDLDIVGRVTEWADDELGEFVVRENVRRRGETSFFRGGGVGAAARHGNSPFPRSDEVLDVLAWRGKEEAVAAWVKAHDELEREVRVQVRGFTWAWLATMDRHRR